MRLISLSAVFASLTLVASCAPPAPSASTELSGEDVETIRAGAAKWQEAALAGDWDALVARYTDDALLGPPNGSLVRGPDELREYFAAFPPLESLEINISQVDGRGDLAYAWGSYRFQIATEGGEPAEDIGRFLEIQVKQGDGTWKISHQIYNSVRPLTE